MIADQSNVIALGILLNEHDGRSMYPFFNIYDWS